MDEVLSSRYTSATWSKAPTFWFCSILHPEDHRNSRGFCLFLTSLRPAMIRSELRSALRRCPTEEAAGSAAGSASPVQPVGQLQSLIAQRMQRAQELLEEMRLQVRRWRL